VPSNAVVSVDGTPVTQTAFKHWMSVAAVSTAAGQASKPVAPEPPNYTACIAHLEETARKEKTKPTGLKKQCETQYKGLTQEVLGFLISSQWVIGEAKALGVNVSDKEVKKQFETIKSQQFPKAAEFEKFLASSGQSVSDLLLRVKLNLLSTKIQSKILKKNSTVTQAQIAKYYNENKSRYGVQEKRNVLLILTKSEAAAKSAKKEIESGKSWAAVAKSVSVDPTSKANGGQLNGVVKGQEEPSLDAVIFSSPVGKLTGPLKTPFGFYVVRVQGITPGNQQSLAQATPSIKAQLAATQQQTVLGKFVKEFKTKWKAKTECRSEFVVSDCKEYKAPKTGTTGTTTTPAAP
jgi:foldase protein PrsA